MKRWEIYLEILCEIILLLGFLFAIGFLLPKTLAFLWPLVAGWVIAMLAHPILVFLQKKLKMPRRLGSAVLIVLVILLVTGVLFLIGSKLLHEGMAFVDIIPQKYREVEATVKSLWNDIKGMLPVGIANKVGSLTNNVVGEVTSFLASERGAGYLGRFAKSVTNGLIGIIVMFMSAYFFLADWININKGIRNIKDKQLKKRIKVIKDNMLGAVGGYFLAQLKIMLIICGLLFVGFLILEVNYTFILAVLISILDALPFLGVGTALIPWALYEFISGKTMFGIGLLVVYVVCLLTRQILQPRIVGGSVGLSSLSTLILMYIGMKLAGIIGFIIAVMLGIIVKRLYEMHMFDGPINRMKYRFEMLRKAD